jgi:hypothetical protein
MIPAQRHRQVSREGVLSVVPHQIRFTVTLARPTILIAIGLSHTYDISEREAYEKEAASPRMEAISESLDNQGKNSLPRWGGSVPDQHDKCRS